jgi:hypothetical protein
LFSLLKLKFPRTREGKIKEGKFMDPEVREIMGDRGFDETK